MLTNEDCVSYIKKVKEENKFKTLTVFANAIGEHNSRLSRTLHGDDEITIIHVTMKATLVDKDPERSRLMVEKLRERKTARAIRLRKELREKKLSLKDVNEDYKKLCYVNHVVENSTDSVKSISIKLGYNDKYVAYVLAGSQTLSDKFIRSIESIADIKYSDFSLLSNADVELVLKRKKYKTTTSMTSTIEALNRFNHKLGYLGTLVSPELQLDLGPTTLTPNQQAGLILPHIPENSLEYDEVVDIKIMLFTIMEHIDISDIDAHPDDYDDLTRLYRRVYG